MADEKLQSKRYIRYVGLIFKLAVAVACLVYIIRCGREIRLENLRVEFVPIAAISALGYFAATFLMVYCWWLCVNLLSSTKVCFKDYCRIYLRSVPAKYLPSNVMHFAARHYLVIQSGVSHSVAAGSNLLENILICMSAGIIIVVGVFSGQLQFPSEFLNANIKPYYIISVLTIATIVVYYLICRFGKQLTMPAIVAGTIKIIAGYIIFLIITGFIFYWVMNSANGYSLGNYWLRIIFIYVCAWTLGLITPGAPGGMGVRESAIIYLMSDITSSELALLGALLFRLVTVSGEIIGYLYSQRS